MKLKNILNLANENLIDEFISKYYDNEFNEYELINLEARFAVSKTLREYFYQELYRNFKITNSIRLAKIRASRNEAIISNLVVKYAIR